MMHRLLGDRTGLRVSQVALGTGRLGTTMDRGIDEGVGKATIAAYLDAGGNFVDTSSAYLGGRAETMIGAVVSGANREGVVIASKYGRTPFAEPAFASVGSHCKAMQADVEGSLRRLGTDRIDVLFAHFDDGVTPIEEVMRGFEQLVQAGKVLYVGLSNFPAWRIASAAAIAERRGWTPPAVLQLQYNLLERAVDREHLPLAQARGLALMAWSPLAGGLLARAQPVRGTYGEAQSSEDGIIKDDQAQAIIDTVVAVAGEMGVEPASVAVAWVAAQGFFPVIGPRHPDQLVDNLRALEVRLDNAHLQRLNEVSARRHGYPYDLLAGQRLRLGIEEPRAGSIL